MQIQDRIKAFHNDMTAWRRDPHAHPELGFEEHRTSEFVAGKLSEFGCDVHRHIGKTGVVGLPVQPCATPASSKRRCQDDWDCLQPITRPHSAFGVGDQRRQTQVALSADADAVLKTAAHSV
jgi:metal-dependent amidase/aminoacylase/carboxypeptidase family protein